MNRYRIKVSFEYFDDEEYDVAKKFVNERAASCVIHDEWPEFRVTIDAGSKMDNFALTDELIDLMALVQSTEA